MAKKTSKLEPYAPIIFDLRGKGTSYSDIAQALNDQYPVQVAPSTVQRFVNEWEDGKADAPTIDTAETTQQLHEAVDRFQEITETYHQELTQALERHLAETDRRVQGISEPLHQRIDELTGQIEGWPKGQQAASTYLRQELGRIWQRAFLIAFGVCGTIFAVALVLILIRA